MNSIAMKAIQDAEEGVLRSARRVDKLKAYLDTYQDEINRIYDAAKEIGDALVDVTLDPMSVSIDLAFTGDKATMEIIFRSLFKLGYKPDTRPKEAQEYYDSFWCNIETKLRIYLKFSSTVCKRIKVGTKEVTVDVYETRCEA